DTRMGGTASVAGSSPIAGRLGTQSPRQAPVRCRFPTAICSRARPSRAVSTARRCLATAPAGSRKRGRVVQDARSRGRSLDCGPDCRGVALLEQNLAWQMRERR
ncbi:MAG: hypothetical protein ACK53Y_05720, partial [bacterium]